MECRYFHSLKDDFFAGLEVAASSIFTLKFQLSGLHICPAQTKLAMQPLYSADFPESLISCMSRISS